MRTSDQINELAEALAKAQGQMHGAAKTSENPFYKSRYADLGECWETIRKPLADNGLAVLQGASCNNGHVVVTTRLAHSSGQWVEDELTMELEKAGPQAIGSVITYARRYSLAAMVGLAQVDDDANAGTNGGAARPPKQWRMTQAMLDQIKAAWYHPREKDLADTSAETKRGLFSEWVLDATGVPYPATLKDWTKEAYEACLAKAEKEKHDLGH